VTSILRYPDANVNTHDDKHRTSVFTLFARATWKYCKSFTLPQFLILLGRTTKVRHRLYT
jgi:hypothetical protein